MKENFKPLDVRKMREIIRRESSKLKLRSFIDDSECVFTLALALSAAVKKIFYEKSEMTFSSEPVLEKKSIVLYFNEMRVDAMEKFNSATVFSVIGFAATEEGLEKQECQMTMIVYLEKTFLPEFLRLLQYTYVDFDDDMEVKDGCGTLANLIAGQYKKEMANLGYKDFVMSTFDSYINTAVNGIRIPKGAAEKYEINFEIEGTRRLTVEMVPIKNIKRYL